MRWSSPKVTWRKIMAAIGALLIIWCGITIPFVIVAFAVAWSQAGIPILFAAWRDQPGLHTPLQLLLLVLVAGTLACAFGAMALWVRFLRTEGLVREEDAWPFGKRQWDQGRIIPSDLQGSGLHRRRFWWIATLACIGLFWALIGGAITPAITIPLALWLVGGVPLLSSMWQRFSVAADGGSYWAGLVYLRGFHRRRSRSGVLVQAFPEGAARFHR